MPAQSCAQCGQPLPVEGRFCTRCGNPFVRAVSAPPPAVTPSTRAPAPAPTAVAPPDARSGLGATIVDARPPTAAPEAVSQATMFGYSSPLARVAPAAAAPAVTPPPPSTRAPASVPGAPITPMPIVSAAPTAQVAERTPPAGPASVHPFKQTVVGMARTEQPILPEVPAGPAPAPEPPPPTRSLASNRGTMIGVALPGIAPLSASLPVEAGPSLGPGSTMLGVATPGIAPTHGAPASAPSMPSAQPATSLRAGGASRRPVVVLPRPLPLVDDEPAVGPAPRVNRSGVPVTLVAGGVFAIVLVVGLAVALLWKGQALVVVPRLDAQGHELVHLTCDSCPDGTLASLGASTAAFHAKDADVLLASALAVGDNPLVIHLARPGLGRSEDVKVVVPIAFRIKADLAALEGPHPAVIVRVQAVAGTVVRVDDKPVTLDAQGSGAYAIDVGAETSGWADDLRLIDLAIPYAITAPASPASRAGAAPLEQSGRLAVRAGIATLHLDAPSPTAVIEASSFRVAGRTVKGATVTLNGQPVPVEADGTFARSYDAASLGDVPLELRASAPQLASRTAHFAVKRVARLDAEARRRERAPWLAYDAMLAAGAAATGKDAVVEGEVVESRGSGAQVVALVDDSRGCNRAGSRTCLVRVVASSDDPLMAGVAVRVYGKVAAGADGATVPTVRADFVTRGRAALP